jgi:hypothetical protein
MSVDEPQQEKNRKTGLHMHDDSDKSHMTFFTVPF